MASLESNKIRELVKSPYNRDTIDRAKKDSKRLRFHTEAITEREKLLKLSYYFVEWVALFLEDEGKRKRFATFLENPPIATVETTEKIWKKLGRIWHTQDSYRGFNFDDQEEDFECREYLDAIDLSGFIKKDCYNEYKISPNSFLVVDMPFEQQGEMPEPLPFVVNIWSLLDYRIERGETQYIIFEEKKKGSEFDFVTVIDDSFYRVYQKNAQGEISQPIIEVPNILGYCPAWQLGSKRAQSLNEQLVINEVLPSIANFDYFLFMKVSKKYLDSYMFPIIEKVEEKCGYTGCIDGRVEQTDRDGNRRWIKCPECLENKRVGAGSVIEKPLPTKEEPDAGDVVKFITPPVEYLDYSNGNILDREANLIANCAGVLEERDNNQAKNRDQILRSYENRIDVLLEISQNFEDLEENVSTAICQLRTGNIDGTVTVNYGTEYYLKDVKDLMEEYKLAKEAGLPEAELMRIKEKIIETKYKNNEDVRARAKILLHLEPFPTMSLKELKGLEFDQLQPDKFQLKAQFNDLINRFEREQLNVIQFGSALDFDRKIGIIQDTLLGYLEESENEAENEGGGGIEPVANVNNF